MYFKGRMLKNIVWRPLMTRFAANAASALSLSSMNWRSPRVMVVVDILRDCLRVWQGLRAIPPASYAMDGITSAVFILSPSQSQKKSLYCGNFLDYHNR